MKAIHFVFCLFAVLMLTTMNGHAAATNEDFQVFLKKFTSSASFQYSRIKFPLKTPIALLEEDVSRFTVNNPKHKEFEAGYDESEASLRVVFELIGGKWYVTDCYTDWYNFDLPISELPETITMIEEENKAFEEMHP